MMTLLSVKDLNIAFPGRNRPVTVTDGVGFEIEQGQSLCLVGESGCGKTMVALGIMNLLPADALVSGTIHFKGNELLSMPAGRLRKIRGRDIAMIFEQPSTCLNPVFTVGEQIAESFRIHMNLSRRQSKEKAVALMRKMGIDTPEKRYYFYPHEFSGGMAQRAMIAMALALKPSLLIADEPTTSLDVTIQAQVIELLRKITAEFNTTLLLISHDLETAARLCTWTAVMYAGAIVEHGPLKRVFRHPRHPYTMALLSAADGRGDRLPGGFVPALSQLPRGCRFHPRCPWSRDVCQEAKPELIGGVRCHLVHRPEYCQEIE